MSNGNAHDNIDNQILIDSIKRIRHASHGNWMEGLFEAETRGGDKRYIHRTSPMLGTEDAWRHMQASLLSNVRENPNFADTLTTQQLPEVIEDMEYLGSPDLIERLLNWIMQKTGR